MSEATPPVDVTALLGDAPAAPAVDPPTPGPLVVEEVKAPEAAPVEEAKAPEVVEVAPEAPAPSEELDESGDGELEVDEDFVDVDAETLELQEAAAAVQEAVRVLDDAKAHYLIVSSRIARKHQEAAPLHVQNQAVRDAQLREAELRHQALANLAESTGLSPDVLARLVPGAAATAAPRKPHPPLFPVQ